MYISSGPPIAATPSFATMTTSVVFLKGSIIFAVSAQAT